MPANTSRFSSRKSEPTYEDISRAIQSGDIKPIYYLMGEESFYIDQIAKEIVEKVLPPEERDFNLLTYYGADTDIDTIILSARGFPMGGERLVVLVREAQALKKIERLEYYLQCPQASTVLIFCHKHGKLDGRLKVAGLIKAQGLLFESKRIYENQVPAFITGYLRQHGADAEPQAVAMLADSIGPDLIRLASEMDKLLITLPANDRRVTADAVNKQVGQNRDFTIFDLLNALAQKDALRVMRIAKYFDTALKPGEYVKVFSPLFSRFAQTMLAYYSPDKSPRGIATWLGVQEWQVRNNFLPMMKNYSGVKVMQILSAIRRADARTKGVDTTVNTSSNDVLRELLYFILH